MQCVILAGGFGTRVSKVTDNKIPKSLICINGVPFIDYQLQYLANQGFENILLCVSFLKEKIKSYVNNGKKWGINVSYLEDHSLGTGAALRQAYDEFALYSKFMVIYGDSFLPIEYKKIYDYYNNQPYQILMTVYKNKNNLDKSNIIYDGSLVYYDKYATSDQYQYIDYGLSFIDRDIIADYIPANYKYDLSTLFTKLSKKQMIAGYEVFNRFYEIGSIDGVKDFTEYIINK
jgi:N-acetyl-alpha-D-muramate 1-phosphate uridylyltransferase